MQQFGLLSEGYLCLFGCWALVLLWGSVLIFMGNLPDKRNLPLWFRNLLYIIFIILSYLNFQCVAAVSYKDMQDPFLKTIVPYYSKLPVVVMIGIYLVGTIIEAWMIHISATWNRTHITNSSIKEAVDTLPTGIVCYDSDGRIVFKNDEMESLSRRMTGKVLLNGNQFEEAVFSNSEIEEFSKDEMNELSRDGMEEFPENDMKDVNAFHSDDKVLRLISENEAWCFYKSFITDDSVSYSMLNAVNISEEYEKTRYLENQKEAVRELNRKLSEYHDDILLIIAEKEKLNAKIKIHDELGAGLLSIKRYLTKGASKEERDAILDRISGSIDYLKRESESESGDEYELMLSTAKALGVDIKIQGKLPSDNPEKHIIATAMHECFTNTLRHAGGDTLYIDIKDCISDNRDNRKGNIQGNVEKSREGLYAVFTNNGVQPTEQVVEKGGLLSLHNLVTEAEGTMEISIDPVFTLVIFIPKEKDIHGLQGFDS